MCTTFGKCFVTPNSGTKNKRSGKCFGKCFVTPKKIWKNKKNNNNKQMQNEVATHFSEKFSVALELQRRLFGKFRVYGLFFLTICENRLKKQFTLRKCTTFWKLLFSNCRPIDSEHIILKWRKLRFMCWPDELSCKSLYKLPLGCFLSFLQLFCIFIKFHLLFF